MHPPSPSPVVTLDFSVHIPGGRYRGPIHSRGNSNSPTLQATRRDKARKAPPLDLRPPKVVTPLPSPTVTLDFSISVHIRSTVGIEGSIHSSGNSNSPTPATPRPTPGPQATQAVTPPPPPPSSIPSCDARLQCLYPEVGRGIHSQQREQ